MNDFQAEKALVRAYYAELDAAEGERISAAVAAYTGTEYHWRGYHPFGALKGAASVAETFWRPLKTAVTCMQRRQDIFFAGSNEIDGHESVWVVSMGHLMGLFDAPWLGIRPTGKMVMLRYCEFNRVSAGQVIEAAMFFDIPHLMAQAGQDPFDRQTGAFLVQPGPMSHDGLLFDPQDAGAGRMTSHAINSMIADLGQWRSGMTLSDELARSWHDDMLWWGPHGIGATYTIARYAQQHAGPFRAAFAERSVTGHVCRLAEGRYGGFFGWPNFSARHTGGFMGLPGSEQHGEFRVIDIYRREGDKLAENWVFVDLLHFLLSQGVDVLAGLPALNDEPPAP